jgi:hypothetical protein
MSARVLTVAAFATGFVACLACGGSGAPDDPAPGIEFAKPIAPAPEVSGLAGELGFPVGDGAEVQESDARGFVIRHRSAFDAGYQWADYRAQLESDGWRWTEAETPPFEGVFVKGDEQITLSCELKGTSVVVRGARIK